MSELKIVYNGLPFKPSLNGHKFSWIDLINFMRYKKGNHLEIDGWMFDLNYGLVYLFERRYWSYYLPPDGIKNKIILDVGGGNGETAKYFLEHGAKKVKVIEANPECEKYLKYNSKLDNRLTYEIHKSYCLNLFYDNYDLLKMDIEGYEIDSIKYLDVLTNKDIVLECHSNYIYDKFLANGFKPIGIIENNKKIFGGVNQICRWKK